MWLEWEVGSPGRGNSTNFNHRNEVAPGVPRGRYSPPQVDPFPAPSALASLLRSPSPASGMEGDAREAKVGAARTERTFLGEADFSGRPGQGHRPAFTAEHPTPSAPLPGGGWGAASVSSGRPGRGYLGGGIRQSAACPLR